MSRNAVQLAIQWAESSGHPKARQYAMRLARAMHREDQIPEGWTEQAEVRIDSTQALMESAGVDHIIGKFQETVGGLKDRQITREDATAIVASMFAQADRDGTYHDALAHVNIDAQVYARNGYGSPDDLQALTAAAVVKRVRTQAGVRRYKAPIGTPIVRDPVTGILKASKRKADAPDPDAEGGTRSYNFAGKRYTGIANGSAIVYEQASQISEGDEIAHRDGTTRVVTGVHKGKDGIKLTVQDEGGQTGKYLLTGSHTRVQVVRDASFHSGGPVPTAKDIKARYRADVKAIKTEKAEVAEQLSQAKPDEAAGLKRRHEALTQGLATDRELAKASTPFKQEPVKGPPAAEDIGIERGPASHRVTYIDKDGNEVQGDFWSLTGNRSAFVIPPGGGEPVTVSVAQDNKTVREGIGSNKRMSDSALMDVFLPERNTDTPMFDPEAERTSEKAQDIAQAVEAVGPVTIRHATREQEEQYEEAQRYANWLIRRGDLDAGAKMEAVAANLASQHGVRPARKSKQQLEAEVAATESAFKSLQEASGPVDFDKLDLAELRYRKAQLDSALNGADNGPLKDREARRAEVQKYQKEHDSVLARVNSAAAERPQPEPEPQTDREKIGQQVADKSSYLHASLQQAQSVLNASDSREGSYERQRQEIAVLEREVEILKAQQEVARQESSQATYVEIAKDAQAVAKEIRTRNNELVNQAKREDVMLDEAARAIRIATSQWDQIKDDEAKLKVVRRVVEETRGKLDAVPEFKNRGNQDVASDIKEEGARLSLRIDSELLKRGVTLQEIHGEPVPKVVEPEKVTVPRPKPDKNGYEPAPKPPKRRGKIAQLQHLASTETVNGVTIQTTRHNNRTINQYNKELTAQGLSEDDPLRGVINHPTNMLSLARDKDGNIIGAVAFSVDHDRDYSQFTILQARVRNAAPAGTGTAIFQRIAQMAQESDLDPSPYGNFNLHGAVDSAIQFYEKMGAEFDNDYSSIGEWNNERRDALAAGTPITAPRSGRGQVERNRDIAPEVPKAKAKKAKEIPAPEAVKLKKVDKHWYVADTDAGHFELSREKTDKGKFVWLLTNPKGRTTPHSSLSAAKLVMEEMVAHPTLIKESDKEQEKRLAKIDFGAPKSKTPMTLPEDRPAPPKAPYVSRKDKPGHYTITTNRGTFYVTGEYISGSEAGGEGRGWRWQWFPEGGENKETFTTKKAATLALRRALAEEWYEKTDGDTPILSKHYPEAVEPEEKPLDLGGLIDKKGHPLAEGQQYRVGRGAELWVIESVTEDGKVNLGPAVQRKVVRKRLNIDPAKLWVKGQPPATNANLTITEMAKFLAERVEAEGGVSMDIKTGKSVDRTSGYAVSLKGFGRPPVEKSKLRAEAASFLAEVLKRKLTGDKFVGAWEDKKTHKVYLDVSEPIEDREQALALGRERGELAIWDFAEGDEIRVPETSATEAHDIAEGNKVTALIEDGMDPLEAEAKVQGVSLDSLRRQRGLERLQAEYGVDSGIKRFEDAVAKGYQNALQQEIKQARAHTPGSLFKTDDVGSKRGFDEAILWRQNARTADALASEGLKSYWKERGRLTKQQFRQNILGVKP